MNIDGMDDNAKRVRIADALDLEVMGDGRLSPTGSIMVRRKRMSRAKELTEVSRRDWLSDLNAMHDGIKAQTPEFRAIFDARQFLMSQSKRVLFCELSARDWAECFIDTQREIAETQRHE